MRAGISRSWWALALHIGTAVVAAGVFYTLWTRKYRAARLCAAAQVTLILLGWAFAQFPYLVEPDMTIYSAADLPLPSVLRFDPAVGARQRIAFALPG